MGNGNVENLKALAEKYYKNKNYLGFTVDVKVDETNYKKYTLHLSNLEACYTDALKKLIHQMLDEAQKFITNEYRLEVLKADEKLEHLRFEKTICREMYFMLNSLLNESMELFFQRVTYYSIRYKQLYAIANVTIDENGNLIDCKGELIA